MKRYKSLILLIIFLLSLVYFYYCIFNHYNIGISCLFHELTNLYCPGCGITRMIYSLINQDFYQAFRYNPLMFLLTPIFLILLGDLIINHFNRRKPLISKIPNKILYFTIVILIIYGIMRNIPYFDYLKPTIV